MCVSTIITTTTTTTTKDWYFYPYNYLELGLILHKIHVIINVMENVCIDQYSFKSIEINFENC